MSNRNRLETHRAIIAAMDAEIADMARSTPSLAQVQLGRARAMLRGADGMIRAALRQPVDVIVVDLVPTAVTERPRS